MDPLLVEPFGHGGVVGRVYPPRRLDPTAFPPIDAVLITHEHEDHFNIPSLNRLDRRIPIYLSALSSTAARTIVREMGFDLRLVRGGDDFALGDLDVFTFRADHVGDPGDEWDVVQFLVRDRSGHGSFFSAVDTEPTRETHLAVRKLIERPGLWCHANNSTDWGCLQGGVVPDESVPDEETRWAAAIARRSVDLSFVEPPAATLFCGGGFSFQGKRAFLNHHVFRVDTDRIVTALRAMTGGLVLAPTPGQAVRMLRGKVICTDEREAFIVTPSREKWPARTYAPSVDLVGEYEPACGRLELGAGEIAELSEHLRDFARYLFGGRIFTGLASAAGHIGRRRTAFALVLLAGGGRRPHVFEYQPESCGFVPVRCDDPPGRYVAGIECWATDLLATLRGELGPSAIVFGRGRAWSFAPRSVPVQLSLLWNFFHPLHRTESFLGLYRRLLALEPARVPRVPPASGRPSLQRRAGRPTRQRKSARRTATRWSVFLSPHLDDAVLSCGGRLSMNARGGLPQQVITVFAGAPAGVPPEVDRHIRVRRAEDTAALTYLGLAESGIVHLDLVNGIYRSGDDGVRRYDPGAMCGKLNALDRPLVGEIVSRLMDRLPDPRSVVVFAPLGAGGHVDHQLTHRAARELSRRGYRMAFYEDVPYSSREPVKGKPGWNGEDLLLPEEHLARKIAALRYYQTQIPALFGDADRMSELLRRSDVERVWHLP